ncbi:MAG: hypothetical protein ACK2U0_18665 [Candidatus Promineifilaceae bacterium]
MQKSKTASWKGTVVDKQEKKKRDPDGVETSYYLLYVKTDDSGKTQKMGISKEMFEDFAVGDRVEKQAGQYYPQKIT